MEGLPYARDRAHLYVPLTSNLRSLPDSMCSRKLNRKQRRSCKACVIWPESEEQNRMAKPNLNKVPAAVRI